MNDYKIERGFRNIYDIDRLKVNINIILSNDNYISYLKDNSLRGLTIYSADDKKKYSVDFSFLKEIPFLEYFECIVPITKQSAINGLYSLLNLKKLRWIVDNKFELDFSKLVSLEVLNTSDYGGMKNWDSLANLKIFHISRLKKDDCSFLSNLNQLTDLKLTKANIISIEGLEYCNKLERLELSYCNKISELTPILSNCPNICSISLIKCKNIQANEIENIKKLGKSLWVR